jgi:hypothetical protein
MARVKTAASDEVGGTALELNSYFSGIRTGRVVGTKYYTIEGPF